MVASRSFNRKVVIQRWDVAAGVDEFRQPVAAWTVVAQPWASIRNVSGLEAVRADAETSVVRTSIRIRYRKDVDASMRVLHGPVIYRILAVLPDEARHGYLDLVCEVPDVAPVV